MREKTLHADDKLLFVKQLYDYCTRATNSKIATQFAERMNVTERSFREKMLTNRIFKGQELDEVEKLYRFELGQETFDKQLSVFIARLSNGDARTKEKQSAAEIKELIEQNEDLEAAQLFGLTK